MWLRVRRFETIFLEYGIKFGRKKDKSQIWAKLKIFGENKVRGGYRRIPD